MSFCDYHLFRPLKKAPEWEKFVNDIQVEEIVRNWLVRNTDIKKLPFRWQECLAINGKYVDE